MRGTYELMLPSKKSELSVQKVVVDLRRMKPHPQRNHVPPERIWFLIYDNLELAVPEQRHLNICMYCADVFRLCVTSNRFDQVIKDIERDDEDLLAA